ncbi:hypothetical protein EV426DRAFT_704322 [Tirmania nivea]|nr:hypothetical protein EV426DRAFT_704322 [Tirmania nivea]
MRSFSPWTRPRSRWRMRSGLGDCQWWIAGHVTNPESEWYHGIDDNITTTGPEGLSNAEIRARREQGSIDVVDLITPESTPEPQSGGWDIRELSRKTEVLITQFLDVRGQVEELEDKVDEVGKAVGKGVEKVELIMKEGLEEMLRMLAGAEKKMKAAVEAITPITQHQIVQAAALQRQPSAPPASPFRIFLENVSMHASLSPPAKATPVIVSPSVAAIVRRLKGDQGVVDSQPSRGAAIPTPRQFPGGADHGATGACGPSASKESASPGVRGGCRGRRKHLTVKRMETDFHAVKWRTHTVPPGDCARLCRLWVSPGHGMRYAPASETGTDYLKVMGDC